MKKLLLLLASLSSIASPALAETEETDALRELSMDRPDQTESPYSVNAGHVQFESDLFSHATSHDAGITMREAHVANTNIRLGVSDRIDLQLVLLPLVALHTEGGGVASRDVTGFGDTAFRVKLNLIGNDGGKFALGLLPFVTLPTASHAALGTDMTEYGLAVPMGFELPLGFGLGAMSQVDLLRDRQRYAAELTHTLTLSHDLFGDFGAFTEVASTLAFAGGTSASLEVHGGLSFAVDGDTQFDGGVFGTAIGDGEDVRAFFGLTLRR